MSEKVYAVPAAWKKRAYVTESSYKKTYAELVKDPAKFWAKEAKRIDWFKFPKKIKNVSFAYPNVSIKWYEDGILNVSYNCIDRHLKKRANQVALIWEGDNPYDDKKITYRELHEHVCRFANVMKKHGVKKGDRVTIYMPMIPRSCLCHAGLRAHWCGSFDRLRRLLARKSCRPYGRCRFPFCHHRR